MRKTSPSGRGSRRRTRGDEGPDLFSGKLREVVKQAFEQTDCGGSNEAGPGGVDVLESLQPAPSIEAVPVGHSSPAETSEPVPLIPPSTFRIPPDPGHIDIHEADAIPARMLNEFVYCPRLFYYEHVDGIFVHNADTVRGKGIHKRVDSGNGAMPDPVQPGETGELPDTIHSRSVSLGSPRLGVSAKLDLVENDAQSPGVSPVDYKVGAPRSNEEGNELWPADRMQLGIQMLLLRENGYPCTRGLIYYRTTKQRVPLDWSPELEAWIVQHIADARTTMRGPIPPPLIDSPKCTRCSLNSICLPDETALLRTFPSTSDLPSSISHLPSKPPRRLIAARDDSRALYLNTPGLHATRKSELIVVKEKDVVLEEIRINDLHHVALFGNIQLTTQAIQILCEREIPISYFSMGGWFYGITRGHGLKNIFTRIEQFRHARDPVMCLRLARALVHGKIKNHRTMLMRLHAEPPAPILAKIKRLQQDAKEAASLESLLGIEGAAAAFYFGAFDGMLKADDDLDFGDGAAPEKHFRFEFSGRNRRPPTDPVNAMLSLAYSLLAKDCTLAALSVGFDPYVGYYHQPRFGRPALALDLMEEFRPLIAESAVLSAINNGMIQPGDFVRAGNAVNLTTGGRKKFFQSYEQRMSHLVTHPVFEYKVSYRRVIELQFRLLARFLTGEIDHYPAFVTR